MKTLILNKHYIIVQLFFLSQLCVSINAFSQEIEHQAPTLQLGLDGLSFSKGSLDAQIIAEIIAAKQGEIKLKLVQNAFLGKITGSGATVYNYADNIIRGIVQEPNAEIRTRKILENTVNLVFVYAFAHYYTMQAENDPAIKNTLDALASSISAKANEKGKLVDKNMLISDVDSIKKIANAALTTKAEDGTTTTISQLNEGINKMKKDSSLKLKAVNNILKKIIKEDTSGLNKSEKSDLKDKMTKSINNAFSNPIHKLDYSSGLISSKLKSIDEIHKDKKTESDPAFTENVKTEFIATIIDIASEVVRANPKLNELGLMKVSYSKTYDYLNLYLIAKEEANANAKEAKEKKAVKKACNAIFSSMDAMLNKYVNYIGTVNYLLEKTSLKNNLLNKNLKFSKKDSGKEKHNIATQINLLDTAIDSISSQYKGLRSKSMVSLADKYHASIDKLMASREYLKKIDFIYKQPHDSITEEWRSDMLYVIQNEIKPMLAGNVMLYPKLYTIIDNLSQFQENLFKGSTIKKIGTNPEPFIQLLGALYNFDKANTFSNYINLLPLLDQVFGDSRIKEAISTINTFVKDYIVIKENPAGNEVIDFNVESFLVKLQNIQSDKIRRLQFHFTVGMNSSFYNKTLMLDDSTLITNLSHFSEKIGVKYKIISKGDWWPRNPGESYKSYCKYKTKKTPPREPLISNWHVLLYGSGILYNVINSSTNKEFSFPTVALGTGITFYNALDFNVSLGVPLFEKGGLKKMFTYPFINAGFDIQFTEYLSAVNKKRKSNKTQKQLTKAVN